MYDTFAPNVTRLSLTVAGERLSGSAAGRPIEGTFTGRTVTFTVRNAKATGTLEGTELKGDIVFPDRTLKWTAVRIPPPPASPKTHDFEPSAFHLYFSSKVAPPLRIHPGDTVRTWSVDAGGVDARHAPLARRQPADRALLCGRRDAGRHAGGAPEPRASQPRLGPERIESRGQSAGAWNTWQREMG